MYFHFSSTVQFFLSWHHETRAVRFFSEMVVVFLTGRLSYSKRFNFLLTVVSETRTGIDSLSLTVKSFKVWRLFLFTRRESALSSRMPLIFGLPLRGLFSIWPLSSKRFKNFWMVARDISVNSAILRPLIPLECNLTIASFWSPFNSLLRGAIYMTSLFTFLFPLSRAPEVTTYGADA